MAGSLILYQSTEQHVRGWRKRWGGGGVGWSRGGRRSWRRSRCGCQQQFKRGRLFAFASAVLTAVCLHQRGDVFTQLAPQTASHDPLHGDLVNPRCVWPCALFKARWETVEVEEFLNCFQLDCLYWPHSWCFSVLSVSFGYDLPCADKLLAVDQL